jgi:3-mercaptopyruvate sulfurtransferase SseA
MNARILFSVFMVGLGLIAAIVPYKHNKPGQLKPSGLLEKSIDDQYFMTVDKVAKSISNEDSTIQIIDLRKPEEFKEANIPGSINIPYKDLLNSDNEAYLDQKKLKNIFYSNGDILSSQAWILCTGMGYQNLYIMQGGMNEWYKTVMNTSFSGERISARENALFEARFKARKLFNEMNSMPDSLKMKFIETKRKNKKKLDGGCG